MNDPLETTQLKQRVKRELGRRMRSLRDALPEAARTQRNQKIVERIVLHPWFESASGIALFWPMTAKGEIDLREVDERARALGKRIYYPFMDPKPGGYTTGFRRVMRVSELTDRGRKFLEPDPSAPSAVRGEIDWVLVPGLAASVDGHRIGYGAGFYDATLPDYCPPAKSAVVIFEFQWIAEVPTLDHDVACDAVFSDNRVVLKTARSAPLE